MLKRLIISILALVLITPFLSACSEAEQETYNTDLAYKIAYYQQLLGTWTGDNITEGTSTNLTGFLLGDGSNIYTIPDIDSEAINAIESASPLTLLALVMNGALNMNEQDIVNSRNDSCLNWTGGTDTT